MKKKRYNKVVTMEDVLREMEEFDSWFKIQSPEFQKKFDETMKRLIKEKGYL